jgi:hypothetical protein
VRLATLKDAGVSPSHEMGSPGSHGVAALVEPQNPASGSSRTVRRLVQMPYTSSHSKPPV